MIRSLSLSLSLTVAVLLTSAIAAANASAAGRTYVANCGNTWYLEFKPDTWSIGCTGGSLNVVDVHWSHYGRRAARGRGTANLRYPCGDVPCYEADSYKAPARLRMTRRARCRTGGAAGRRFFSRVRIRIKYGADNPFGRQAGWETERFRIRAYEGRCEFAP